MNLLFWSIVILEIAVAFSDENHGIVGLSHSTKKYHEFRDTCKRSDDCKKADCKCTQLRQTETLNIHPETLQEGCEEPPTLISSSYCNLLTSDGTEFGMKFILEKYENCGESSPEIQIESVKIVLNPEKCRCLCGTFITKLASIEDPNSAKSFIFEESCKYSKKAKREFIFPNLGISNSAETFASVAFLPCGSSHGSHATTASCQLP
ncbi:uncharacterized protein LOC132202583 [Neocloeon triangulifer]|uniref:uncharacterized protein LOC132202583 n=1 Tax=Neocloeon triangulifer TaxID=2078957 RepID=UPI00286F916A|nr:uncharacterized protein LOC132202583 [Neocloeon triangulifer]